MTLRLDDANADRPDAKLADLLAQQIAGLLGSAHPMTGALALSIAMAEHHLSAPAAVGGDLDLDREAWLEDSLDQCRRLLALTQARDEETEEEDVAAATPGDQAVRLALAAVAADLLTRDG